MFGFDVAGGVYLGAVWYGVLTGLPTKGIVLMGVPLLDAGGLFVPGGSKCDQSSVRHGSSTVGRTTSFGQSAAVRVGAVELMVGILPTPIGLLRL